MGSRFTFLTINKRSIPVLTGRPLARSLRFLVGAAVGADGFGPEGSGLLLVVEPLRQDRDHALFPLQPLGVAAALADLLQQLVGGQVVGGDVDGLDAYLAASTHFCWV